MKPVYLDYNSTTPVDERVLQVMLPYFSEHFGNAASRTHSFGWIADEAVKKAREQVAALVNAEPGEIIFTSGATESVNLGIKGIAESYRSKGNHIVTIATEHKAVLDTCSHLEKTGMHVTVIPVHHDGTIDLNLLEQTIQMNTVVVAIMMANNETGIIHPLKQISEIVHEKKCILLCDATQACGKIPVDVQSEGIDLLCMSAHKYYGPKGIGAIYIRRRDPRVSVSPLIDGGGHERGLRSGTLNVPAIVGFGMASELAGKEMQADETRITALRDLLEKSLMEIQGTQINGAVNPRMFNVTNLSFSGINANALIKELSDVAVATGSACTSAIPEPSHVLKAMRIPESLAYSSIRFSLGKYTTEEEIQYSIKRVKEVVVKLRSEG